MPVTYARHFVQTDVGPRIYNDINLTESFLDLEAFKRYLSSEGLNVIDIDDSPREVRVVTKNQRYWRGGWFSNWLERPLLLRLLWFIDDDTLIEQVGKIAIVRGVFTYTSRTPIHTEELIPILEAAVIPDTLEERQGKLYFTD